MQLQQWELQSDSSSLRINLELCSCSVSHSKCLSTAMLIIPALLTASLAPSQKLSSAYMSCHLDKHKGKPAQQTGRKATSLGHLLPVTKAQRVEAQVPRPKPPVNTELIWSRRSIRNILWSYAGQWEKGTYIMICHFTSTASSQILKMSDSVLAEA